MGKLVSGGLAWSMLQFAGNILPKSVSSKIGHRTDGAQVLGCCQCSSLSGTSYLNTISSETGAQGKQGQICRCPRLLAAPCLQQILLSRCKNQSINSRL